VVVAIVTRNSPLNLELKLLVAAVAVSEHTISAESMLEPGKSKSSSYAPETLATFGSITGPDFASDFRVLSELLARRGLGFPLRLVDSSATVSAFMLEVIEFCHSFSVRALIFPVTPHQFESYTLYAVGKQLGLRMVIGQPTGIGNLIALRDENGARIEVTDLVRKKLPSKTDSEGRSAFRAKIRDRREGRVPSYIESQRARDSAVAQMGTTRKILAVARWMFVARYPKALGSLHFQRSSHWIERLFQIAMPRYWSAVLRGELEAVAKTTRPRGPFALFALHYEPERTVQPEGGNYDNQLRAVVAARQLLADSVHLVVKEHSSQSSTALRGWMGRSPLTYRILARLPNTTLIDGRTPASDLIGSATSVYTITGTVGLEAALVGVPVFHFGRPWWEGLPGTSYVGGTQTDEPNPHPGGQSLPKDVDSFLNFLYDRYLIPTFALDGSTEVVQEIVKALATELTDDDKGQGTVRPGSVG